MRSEEARRVAALRAYFSVSKEVPTGVWQYFRRPTFGGTLSSRFDGFVENPLVGVSQPLVSN